MHLSGLGIDILLLHLAPFLSPADLLSLTAADSTLYFLLGHLRFQRTVVSTAHGSVLDILRSSTLPNIRHITLNGSVTENQRIFSAPEMRSVPSATIITAIPRAQSHTFALFVPQLTELTEGKPVTPSARSSLTYLPPGSLSHLKFLRLEISLPVNLQSLLSVAHHLTTLQFFHFPSEASDAAYDRYAGTITPLCTLLSSRSSFPSLRLVQFLPGSAASNPQAQSRQTILTAIWNAIKSHGGWRLQARNTSRQAIAFPKGWLDWWTERDWDFFLTSEELNEFRAWCRRERRPAVLASFVCGRVHLQVTGCVPGVLGIVVYGVSVFHGGEITVHDALGTVTKDTRAITITLDKYWGVMDMEVMEPRFGAVEALKINGPEAKTRFSRLVYGRNISANLVRTLGVRNWHGLRNLSLPVYALHKPSATKMKVTASCGMHIPAYELSWLGECPALQALDLTEWSGCFLCRLPEEVSLHGGLRHLGPRVEFLQVGGHIRCPASARALWKDRVEEQILESMKMRKPRVKMVVLFRGLMVSP